MKESLKHIFEITSGITLFVLLTAVIVYLSDPDSNFSNYLAQSTVWKLVISLTITIIVIALLNIKSGKNKKN